MNSMPTEQTARLSRGSRSSRFNRRILHKNGVIKKINCVITLSSKPFLRPQWAVGGDKMLYRMPYLGHGCEAAEIAPCPLERSARDYDEALPATVMPLTSSKSSHLPPCSAYPESLYRHSSPEAEAVTKQSSSHLLRYTTLRPQLRSARGP